MGNVLFFAGFFPVHQERRSDAEPGNLVSVCVLVVAEYRGMIMRRLMIWGVVALAAVLATQLRNFNRQFSKLWLDPGVLRLIG